MLLQYIRHEMALRDGLPFGALFAGHIFKDVSFLWSSEFWGTANGTFANKKRKWKLVGLLIVCTFLGLTVGPIYGGSNQWPIISIEPHWAQYLNPTFADGNSSVFRELSAAAGLGNMSSLSDPDTGYLVESILATMIANGLARRHYKHGIIGELEGWDFDSTKPVCGSWCKQMMPLYGSIGSGGSVYTLNESSRANATKLTMHAESMGYAYSPKGFTTILSIAVLFIYSIIVLIHWVYMIWAKEGSNNWHDSPEIAALAMNSRPTDVLHNTGAGVDTSRIFKHQVRIVSIGEKVELSFGDQPDQERIALNAWYS